MSEQPYTNRELEYHFTEIKATLVRIEEQTKKTNGRVTALEGWKSWIAGAMTLVGVISGMVVYIYFTEIGHIQTQLEAHINEK